MKTLKRVFAVSAVLLVIGFATWRSTYPRITKVYAQATVPVGFVAPTNLFPPAAVAGQAGTVTNTSGFLMQIDGGPIYCSGAQDSIAESNITLAANTTYLIVYNCPQALLYAKTAVTGPGSSGTSVGIPTSLLFPIGGVEVPIANVVCGASTCATITDQRPIASFPAGAVQAGSVTFANLPATFPNGGVLYCSNCLLASSPCSGASTGAMALRVNGAWRCQ